MKGIRQLLVAGLMFSGTVVGLTAHAHEIEGNCAAVGGVEDTCTYVASGNADVSALGVWELTVTRTDGRVFHLSNEDTWTHKNPIILDQKVDTGVFLTVGVNTQPGDTVTLSATGSGSHITATEHIAP